VPTAFLDRDGTINREVDFLGRTEQLELLPGALEAVQRLHGAGYRIIITTNQSGIARGFYSECDLARVHERLHEWLGRLPLAYLHCPHLPPERLATAPLDGGDAGITARGVGYQHDCACRKPKPGMVHSACAMLKDFGVTLDGSVVIGDSARDLLMADGLPLKKILVASGKPVAEQRQKLAAAGCVADHEATDLLAAVTWLLGPV
jgi:D-glycero-D-manno-heptose 1,7-bisphosphate phosphatase